MLCVRRVCEAEMEVTRAELARTATEIARITPLTPDGNRIQSWPIGMFPNVNVLHVLKDVISQQS